MGHCRVRFLGRNLSLELSFLCFSFGFACLPPWTNVTLSLEFADKERITPQLSLVNVQGLNLILAYEPLSRALVDAGQAIRAGSPQLARINVSILGFLTRRDLPPVQLPAQRVLPAEVVPGEGADFSHSSLEVQIDQFHFFEEGEALSSRTPIQI